MIGLGLGVALAPTRGGLSEVSLFAGIAEMPLGPVGANTLDGFTGPASVTYIVGVGAASTAVKVLQVASGWDWRLILATNDTQHRDMEVDVWAYGTVVFLRLDEDGNAICFTINAAVENPEARITLARGFVEGVQPPEIWLWSSAGLATQFPDAGIGENHTTDIYTCGVSGCDIYLKFNGVELVRIRSHLHVKPGSLALTSVYGIRQADVRLLVNQAMFGNPAQGLVDLRDLGGKALKTTGTIAAASTALTVADATGFEVGDPIILAVGGEAGEGERETVGVGGTHPALAYADLATMEADTGKPDGTGAYRQDNGQVYVSYGGVWSSPFYSYYSEKFFPIALKTTIEAIVGNVLTLADPAVAASTDCDVWFDNEPALKLTGLTNQMGWDGVQADDLQVRLLDGDFAIGASARFDDCPGFTFYGGGTEVSRIVVPDGVLNGEFGAYLSTGVTARDFSYLGNGRDRGFGLTNRLVFTSCEGLLVERVELTDPLMGGVHVYSTSEFTVQDCSVTLTQGHRSYMAQWLFNAIDCNCTDSVGQIVDCRVESPTLVPGFEMFRSAGVDIIRPVGVNALISSNYSGLFLIDEPDITIHSGIEEAGAYTTNQFTSANPIIGINANAPIGTAWVVAAFNAGGLIRNPRVIQEGYVDGERNMISAINVTSSPNVRVEGAYPAFPGQGLLYGPDYAPGVDHHGPIGVNSDSAGTTIRGIRTIGATGNGWGGINAPADAVVEDCVSDLYRIAGVLVPPPATCMTNADWLALHPGDTGPGGEP